MVEAAGLVKYYGNVLAVDHVSFSLRKGNVYGLLGPNGAGKSTTMNMLTGYLSPDAGTVVICGHDMRKEPEKAKGSIGYLPEIPPLYTEMTPREFLRYAAMVKGVPKKSREEEVGRVADLAGLNGVERRLISGLSKGYRQRVGLAYALIGDPPVLILDEPSAGVDTRQMVEIRRLIRKLKKDHLVILSSHIMQEIQQVCDQVLIIFQGRLAAAGTPEELYQLMNDKGDEDASELEAVYLKLTEQKGERDI